MSNAYSPERDVQKFCKLIFCDYSLTFDTAYNFIECNPSPHYYISVITGSAKMENVNCTDDTGSLEQEEKMYQLASWWLECVAELSIGVMGLLGNGVAILLLRSDRLASTFNRLLIGLCVVDNLFILSCCLEAIRRFVGTSNFHELAFIYFLYQLQSISLSCSINMTVVLAIER